MVTRKSAKCSGKLKIRKEIRETKVRGSDPGGPSRSATIGLTKSARKYRCTFRLLQSWRLLFTLVLSKESIWKIVWKKGNASSRFWNGIEVIRWVVWGKRIAYSEQGNIYTVWFRLTIQGIYTSPGPVTKLLKTFSVSTPAIWREATCTKNMEGLLSNMQALKMKHSMRFADEAIMNITYDTTSSPLEMSHLEKAPFATSIKKKRITFGISFSPLTNLTKKSSINTLGITRRPDRILHTSLYRNVLFNTEVLDTFLMIGRIHMTSPGKAYYRNEKVATSKLQVNYLVQGE